MTSLRWFGFPLTLASLIVASPGCGDAETGAPTATTGGGGGAGTGTTTTGGGGSGGDPTTGGSGGQPEGGGAPGELTIDVAVAGANGKTVIVSVLQGTTKVAGVCTVLAGDPAMASAVAKGVGSNPCVLGDPVLLEGGLFTLRGGLYGPGSPAPSMCVAQDVLVDGNTTVTLSALQACP